VTDQLIVAASEILDSFEEAKTENACPLSYHGAELLRVTDLSIHEIALQVGYASGSHFAARFRRILGEQPTAYRKRYRKG
jgi:AraC-like DNA-binding protein